MGVLKLKKVTEKNCDFKIILFDSCTLQSLISNEILLTKFHFNHFHFKHVLIFVFQFLLKLNTHFCEKRTPKHPVIFGGRSIIAMQVYDANGWSTLW